MSRKKLVLIPVIGTVSFTFSQWLVSFEQPHFLFSLSSDFSGGLSFGIGIGLMIFILKRYRSSSVKLN